LEQINDTPVAELDFEGKRNEWTVRRDFNLSFAADARDDNPIVDGQWWDPDTEEALLSLEHDFADELGVEIGDVLHFRVADALVAGRISNLRQVEWESFSANFFVVGTPAAFANSPASYITSVNVPDDHGGFVRELVSRFPAVTVLEVGSILERVTGIMNRAAAAVQYVFLFTVFAGILVLIAAVLASRRERFREAAILRTLGASRRYLRGTLGREFAVIGLLSGVLAATVAAVIGWIIVEYVMELSYQFNPWLWLVGVATGLICIWTAGMLVTRPVLDQSPLDVLRNQV
jgi:putative ABC transport system permease protein